MFLWWAATHSDHFFFRISVLSAMVKPSLRGRITVARSVLSAPEGVNSTQTDRPLKSYSRICCVSGAFSRGLPATPRIVWICAAVIPFVNLANVASPGALMETCAWTDDATTNSRMIAIIFIIAVFPNK